MASKYTSAERKALILDAAAKCVSKYGARNVTRRMVAKLAGCSEALVAHYLGGTESIRRKGLSQAKAMGLPMLTAAKAIEIGQQLRKHK
jgi:AcrR family transcriptional regulator